MRSHIVHPPKSSPRASRLPWLPLVALLLAGGVLVLAAPPVPASAIGTAVGLGTAGSYSVLAGQTVTNTGPSQLAGNIGVSPGSAVAGFPPGLSAGVIHAADSQALQAQADLATAYDQAAGQASDANVGAELGGSTLVAGVYTASSSTQITGPLTLDAQGDPNAVFIFQIGSGLTTASNSSVVLLNDAQSCNVFWQVAESATLGTDTAFVGTIMALTSIEANTGATIIGRALARNGSVTLDNNVFTDTTCATTSTTAPTDTSSASASSTETSTVVAPTGPATTALPSGSAGSSSATSTAAATSSGGSASPATTSSRTASTAAARPSSSGSSSTASLLATTGLGSLTGPLIMIGVGLALAGLAMVMAFRKRTN